MKKIIVTCSVFFIGISCTSLAQNAPGFDPFSDRFQAPEYDPFNNPDIDMYIAHWSGNTPIHTHGELVEFDIFTKGSNINPPYKGAVLELANSFRYANLRIGVTTWPVTPKNEQEIYLLIIPVCYIIRTLISWKPIHGLTIAYKKEEYLNV